MPLRSAKVVESAASDGGLWFQSGCMPVSSVRDGQFMVCVWCARKSGWKKAKVKEEKEDEEKIQMSSPG